ncbi:fluorothreonine transaldolase [Actinopolyspora mzabensis]|uniref:Fluorothreonine transaldolase n=1 Tax=Actinopolyspora mzabensis TaxID=995066 RepID=A0A1G9EPH1_ACTMZ|nr:fluorothreonine transaldolase [Actinopolyspora mzabensis]SDK78082.1 fluorothreonine transaldolase [Actinopolyspora mzabensis]
MLSREREPLSLSEISRLVSSEEKRSESVLHLTANETVLSPFAQQVLSSPLANRYLLEHLDMRQDSPSRLNNFLFRGLDGINHIEDSASEVCNRMFGGAYAEFRCLSGLHAMQTTFSALTSPGDRIMRISTKDGGHFLTELICRSFGRESCTYVFRDISEIDLERTEEVIESERPALLYIDAMNYLFPFPVRELKRMAGGAPLIYDASHTLGLIAGGKFQNPLEEGADVLQANTHKTFYGPQKGLILGRDRGLMERISYVLSNGMVSSQHTASTLALFIALHETYYEGANYAQQVLDNAQYLARGLDRRGVPVVAKSRGFTRNHMLFVDTRDIGSGPMLMDRLLAANISVNRSPAFKHVDALRLGVQEVTRRGWGAAEMDQAAEWIADVLFERVDPVRVRAEVESFVGVRDQVYFTGADRSDPVEGFPAASAPNVSQYKKSKRWIDISLTRETLDHRDHFQELEDAKKLGRLGGGFAHQTDSAGNISFLAEGRQYVTLSGAYIKDLTAEDFVEITRAEGDGLRCRGLGPASVEAYMHHLLAIRLSAGFVVHNHFIPDADLDKLGVSVIPPQEYGSVALAESVAEAAEYSQKIYVRRHGLVFWAHSFDEAYEMIKDTADAVTR